MKQIQCLLALLLMLSPFARAVADDSQQIEANNIKAGIANVQEDIEAKKKYYQSEEKTYRKIIDDLTVALDSAMKTLAQETDKHTREVYSGIVAGDKESIRKWEQYIAKLHIDRNKALQELNDRLSKLQIRLTNIKLQQDQQASAKTTSNLNHWAETNRFVSPGFGPAADASPAVASPTGPATAAGNPPGNNYPVRNDAAAGTLPANPPAPQPMLLAQATPMPALTQPAATKLSGDDKLTLATLNDIIADMNQPTDDAAKRTKLLNEFLTQSEPFVANHPDYTNLWVARATAALETDNAEAGWKAGQQLKRLNVLDGDDAKAIKAMSGLKRKGWLVDDYETLTKAQADAAQAEVAKRAEVLNGYWVSLYSGVTESVRITFEEGKLKFLSWSSYENVPYDHINSTWFTSKGEYRLEHTSQTLPYEKIGPINISVAAFDLSSTGAVLRLIGKGSGHRTIQSVLPPDGPGSTGRLGRDVGQDEDINFAYYLFVDYEKQRLISISDEECKMKPTELAERFKSLTASTSSHKIFTRQ